MPEDLIQVPQRSYSMRSEPATGTTLAPVENTPMSMLAVAIQRGLDAKTISDLMALQREWEANEARKAYNVAFAAFKAEAVTIIKNKIITDGPLKGKSYADLHAIIDATVPYLSKHGLSHNWQRLKDEKDWIEIQCVLKHNLGHSEAFPMGGPPDTGGAKNPIQARGSTLTYLEKYTFLGVTGLAARDQDTDGNGKKETIEPDPEGKKLLEACRTDEEVRQVWKDKLTPAQRRTLHGVLDDCAKRLAETSQ